MTQVMVTGAAGFVGRAVVVELEARGVEVLEVRHRWSSPAELLDRVGGRRVDRCIHLGWYADPADYLTAVAPNDASVRSAAALLEVLPRLGCRSVVMAGSCAEYAPSALALREDDPIEPSTVYGTAKDRAHRLAASVADRTGLRLTWARIFNVTGPGEHPDRLFPRICRQLVAGRPVELGSHHHVRDYLDVEDVAGALAHVDAGGGPAVVNVCSGAGRSVHELVTGLARRLDRMDLLRCGAATHGGLPVVLGDTTRLAATGWRPRHGETAMLDRVAAPWLC